MQQVYIKRAVFASYATVAAGFGLDEIYKQEMWRSCQLPLMEKLWFFAGGALVGPPAYVINKAVQGVAWFRNKQ